MREAILKEGSMVYYIDSLVGDSSNSGTNENQPLDSMSSLIVRPGDEILFRRGTSYRYGINFKGMDGEPVKFGAYGNGNAPVFYGSVNRSEQYLWNDEGSCIWSLKIPMKNEPCNMIFDFGDHCGIYVSHVKNLDMQGKWTYAANDEVYTVYMYSSENPGSYYSDIEISVKDGEALFTCSKNVAFEGLCIMYPGDDGILIDNGENVTLSDVRFEYAGGYIYNNKEEVRRKGNAVTVLGNAQNIKIEDCYFYNTFDSCIELNGTEEIQNGILIRGNTFNRYGIAALTVTGNMGSDTVFELNECTGAGRGFSYNGIIPPRHSKFDPEPVGHNVMCTCVKAGEKSKLTVRRNVFLGRINGSDVFLDDTAKNCSGHIRIENNEDK